MSARTSPLHARHLALGASFTDFGGWSMPVRYGSDLAEHRAVREAAGLFDISHMAQFVVGGPDAAAFLDHAVVARVSALALSKAKYSMLLADDGGVLDDLIVTRNTETEFLVVANAANHDVVAAELEARRSGFDATVTDLGAGGQEALIALQGPLAERILAATEGVHHVAAYAMGHTLETLPYYTVMGLGYGDGAVLVSRTGYTGEDGFEIGVTGDDAPRLWDAILAAGAELGLIPCGLAARDTLRLEAGMPLYGHELTRATQPVQAGLGRIVPTAKPEFVGRDAVLAGPGDGARMLVGLVADGRRAARAGYPVFDGETEVGVVTSGALSPTLGRPIAMAMVDPHLTEPGTVLDLDVRGTRVPATVTTMPFYRREQ